MKVLIPLALILALSTGCISIPRLFGIGAKTEISKNPVVKIPKTPKQHAKGLCRLGMTIGFAAFIIGVVLLVVGKIAPKIAITAIVAGLAVFIASYFVETYLEPILYSFIALGVAAASFLIWRNWEKLKAMARFGDAVSGSAAGAHTIADEVIGPEGSSLRKEIKAVVTASRK